MNKIEIVFGIAASGKDTLLKGLFRGYLSNDKRIVNYTTRRLRPNEVSEENYHFITDEKFEKREKINTLLIIFYMGEIMGFYILN